MDESDPPRGGALDAALTAAERRRVAVAAAVPVVLVLVVLVVLVAVGRLAVVDVVVGTVLYGGLLGLTAAVVAHEHAVAAHCPRCGAGQQRRASTCRDCGYDLDRRPVYVCEERHERAYAPGVCSCGRRLVEREPAPGLGRRIRRTLWIGLWVLALLVGTGLLLRLTG